MVQKAAGQKRRAGRRGGGGDSPSFRDLKVGGGGGGGVCNESEKLKERERKSFAEGGVFSLGEAGFSSGRGGW